MWLGQLNVSVDNEFNCRYKTQVLFDSKSNLLSPETLFYRMLRLFWWIFWKKVFIAQWWFAQWRRKCVVITISSPPEHLELLSLEGCVSISNHLAEFRPYNLHCVKSVRIWSYSGPRFSISPHSVRMWENTNDNFKHGHFLRSAR